MASPTPSALTALAEWRALEQHCAELKPVHLREIVSEVERMIAA